MSLEQCLGSRIQDLSKCQFRFPPALIPIPKEEGVEDVAA